MTDMYQQGVSFGEKSEKARIIKEVSNLRDHAVLHRDSNPTVKQFASAVKAFDLALNAIWGRPAELIEPSPMRQRGGRG